MFGYIRICKPQMKICEYEVYQSVYCTLCRCLGKRMGLPARLLLNYDYTFLTMLKIALSEQDCRLVSGHCVVNPLKKCGRCTTHDDAFDYTAALTAIMFYYKLRDNLSDSSGVKKLLWHVLLPYASHIRKKAARLYPEEDALVSAYLRQQFEAEKKARDTLEVLIDELCEPTANVISAMAIRLSDDPEKRILLRHFGYYLGRWIYLIDALDDLNDDLTGGTFNPLALKFGLTARDAADITDLYEQARCSGNESLNSSIAEAIKYYELLNLGAFKPILDNIMYLGTSEAQKTALFRPHGKKAARQTSETVIRTGAEKS